MKKPRYALTAGRVIERDGVLIAYLSGVSKGGVINYGPPYVIGMPADLDDFAHEIVAVLNRSGKKR